MSTIVLYKLNNVIDRDRYNMCQRMFMTSSISSVVMLGRIVGVQRASKVLPEPGGGKSSSSHSQVSFPKCPWECITRALPTGSPHIMMLRSLTK